MPGKRGLSIQQFSVACLTTVLALAGSTGPKAQPQVLDLGSIVLKEREAGLGHGAWGPGVSQRGCTTPGTGFP